MAKTKDTSCATSRHDDRRAPTEEKVCTVGPCSRLAKTSGLCGAHYERLRKFGDVRASDPVTHCERHGKSGTVEYKAWSAMVQRCTNPADANFQNYGGRGIEVCKRWRRSFPDFLADVGHRPDGGEIDRIDNDGHYEPNNVRWASRAAQMRNTRRNKMFVCPDGVARCMKDVSDRYGIAKSTLRHRVVDLGWDIKRAISEPVRRRRVTLK